VIPEPAALERVVLRPQESAAFPLDLARLHPRPAPLAIEIGFGGGEALAWWAGRRPEWNFLGFERAQESVQRAAGAVVRAGAGDQVRLVLGDARHLLRELVPPAAAVRVLMQFPMPWPKARHAKHRLTDPDFIAALSSVLAPGGRFELVTDQEVFAREAELALQSHSALQLSALERDPARSFRTRYERRWLAEGRSIWRLTAVQVQPRPCAPLSQSPTMTHFALAQIPSDSQVQALAGQRMKEGDGVGVVQEVFTAADGWLLQALSADGSFSQRFLIRLRRRAQGGCLLSLEDCARPYPTPAVTTLLRSLQRRLA
jgi:tRNA (guanine-N7-)-methyltransferase